MLRSMLAAAAFLTRLPVVGHPFSSDELRRAAAYFPVVGLVLGGMLATIHALALPLGAWSAAGLTVGASLLLTGAFHEDGLADTADALGGGYTKARVFEILKDSRLGTFGVSALVVTLVLRIAVLAELRGGATAAFLVIECLSRTPPVIILALVPYATPQNAAKSRDLTRGGVQEAALASLVALFVLSIMAACGVVSVGGALALLSLSSAVGGILTRYFLRRVGGITGDFLGAVQQLVALSLWVAWATAR